MVQRNPVIASLSAAVALILLAATGVSTRFAIEAESRAQEAILERGKAVASQTLEAQQRQRAQEAEAQATADARRASIEAEKAQQVARFLAEMFAESAALDFSGIRVNISEKSRAGANLTAREILDRGAQRVTEQLKDQPVVQAALKETMGSVYVGLGMLPQAEPLLEAELFGYLKGAFTGALLEEALDLRRQHLPREHLDTASSLHSISILRFAQGRYTECAAAAREALAIRRKLLGDNHEQVDVSKLTLAMFIGLAPGSYSDTQDAVRLPRESIEWRRSHFGNAHLETAFAILVLAGTLINQGANDEASKLVLEATPIFLTDPATKPVGQALAQFQQALIMEKLGQRGAYVSAMEKAIAATHSMGSDGNPIVAYFLGLGCDGIAWVRATSPDARYRNGAVAVEYATKACELSKWNHWGRIDTLAAAYAEQGNFEEAIRWQTKAIELAPTEPDKKEGRELLDLYKTGQPYREKN